MADVFSIEKRSDVMSKIKGSGNKSTELKLIAVFKELGITGWRRGNKMTGKPDFVFPKLKTAVFADGCFWHGHDCQRRAPKTHADFWIPKIARNKQRDIEVSEALKAKGWLVLRIWECELKKKSRAALITKLRPLTSGLESKPTIAIISKNLSQNNKNRCIISQNMVKSAAQRELS